MQVDNPLACFICTNMYILQGIFLDYGIYHQHLSLKKVKCFLLPPRKHSFFFVHWVGFGNFLLAFFRHEKEMIKIFKTKSPNFIHEKHVLGSHTGCFHS